MSCCIPANWIAGPSLSVCHGTSAVPFRVVRVGERFAQLRLSRPLVVARGDRVVLRQRATVGGGVVLDPDPPRRLDASRLELLERGDPRSLVAALVEAPVELEVLASASVSTRCPPTGLSAWTGGSAPSPGSTRRRSGSRRARCPRRRADHERRRRSLGDADWAGAVSGLLGCDLRNGKLYVAGRAPAAGDRGAALEQLVAESGLEPVPVDDGRDRPPARARGPDRAARRRPGNRSGGLQRFKSVLLGLYEEAGTVTLAAFRDRAGVSRRVAQLVLERFDADRLTLRVGDERRLRRSAQARE